MDGTVQREVELHVPLQAIDGGPLATDPQVRPQLVRGGVCDDVPVPGRRLGLRSVRPEFCQRPREVALVDDFRLVRLAGHRIDASTGAIVGAQWIVATSRRRYVDQYVLCRIEPAAVADDLDCLVLVCLICRWIA